jgi:hypothetical protein
MWQDLHELQKDIDELKQKALRLGSLMQDAGVQLRSGMVSPEPDLLTNLEHYLKSFQQIRSLVGVEIQYSPQGHVLPESINSLETALKRKLIHHQTREVLDSVLSLCHDQQVAFAPLDALKERVEEIKNLLNSGKMTASESQTRMHEFQQLLKLVTEAEHLNDQEWTALMDEVIRVFGRPLATAAARGHLGMLVA